MPSRSYRYSEALGSQNSTSATYANAVAVAFVPDDSSTYILLWSALIQNTTNLTTDAKVRLFDSTNSITYQEQNYEMKDLADWHAVGGVSLFTTSTGSTTRTYNIQWAAETAGNSINIKEARILALKLDAEDQSVYTAGNVDTTSTSFADGQTLTFTPATSGDYLIIAACDHTNFSNGDPYSVAAYDGPTGLNLSTIDGIVAKDATNFLSYNTMWKKTLAASSSTFKIQFKNDPGLGDTIRLRNRCIVALRLDKWDASYYSETRGRSTTASTTYVTGNSLTQTTEAKDYMILACGLYDGTSTTLSNFMSFNRDSGSEKTEMLHEQLTSGQGNCWFHIEKETLTAASHTWQVRAKSETASTTTGYYDMAIAVLLLTSTTPPFGVTDPYSSPNLISMRRM